MLFWYNVEGIVKIRSKYNIGTNHYYEDTREDESFSYCTVENVLSKSNVSIVIIFFTIYQPDKWLIKNNKYLPSMLPDQLVTQKFKKTKK